MRGRTFHSVSGIDEKQHELAYQLALLALCVVTTNPSAASVEAELGTFSSERIQVEEV